MEKLFVQLFEFINAFLFVIEYLYDLLTFHHLFNISVFFSEVVLLGKKVFSALACDIFGDKQHYRYHKQCQQSQRNTEHEHTCKHGYYCYCAVEHLYKALTNHLPESIYVVGINTHYVAVRMRVKILYRQAFHMSKDFASQVLHRTLSNVNHNF